MRSAFPALRHYGGRQLFAGPIRTVRTFEDNGLVRQLVSGPGEGAVLVVDGGGSLRTALSGDVVAGLAAQNGWAALVLWGAVRDVAALRNLELAILALGSNPWTSGKAGTGEVDVPLRMGNVTFTPGGWVYGDEDGLLVAETKLPG